MPGRTANVRYWGEIGLNADIGLWAVFGPQADLSEWPLLIICWQVGDLAGTFDEALGYGNEGPVF
jgi:hypothetical protein